MKLIIIYYFALSLVFLIMLLHDAVYAPLLQGYVLFKSFNVESSQINFSWFSNCLYGTLNSLL